MTYKIELTENFKKEAKKLIQKYASLRSEIIEMGKELEKNQLLELLLERTFIKSDLLLHLKTKGSLVEQE
jgi:hypothetical protein